jgi:hypothetical protein
MQSGYTLLCNRAKITNFVKSSMIYITDYVICVCVCVHETQYFTVILWVNVLCETAEKINKPLYIKKE